MRCALGLPHPTGLTPFFRFRFVVLRTAIRIDGAFAAAAGAFFAARGAGSAARGVAHAARGALSAARGAESAGDGVFCAGGRVESAASHALSADDRAKSAARDAFCAARGEKSVIFRAAGNVESRSGSGFRVEHGMQDGQAAGGDFPQTGQMKQFGDRRTSQRPAADANFPSRLASVISTRRDSRSSIVAERRHTNSWNA